MTKKSERKRKAVQKAKREEVKSSSLKRPSYAKAFLQWREDRPSKLLKELKEMGYLKNDTNRDVREIDNKPSERDVSKGKKKTST